MCIFYLLVLVINVFRYIEIVVNTYLLCNIIMSQPTIFIYLKLLLYFYITIKLAYIKNY